MTAASAGPVTPAGLQAMIASGMAARAGGPPPVRLAPLREDLSISQGPLSALGRPTWLVYDPLRHRYVDLDANSLLLLSLWRSCSTIDELARAATERRGEAFAVADIEAFSRFLAAHALTSDAGEDAFERLRKAASTRPHGVVMTVVHNYLFFRIPLVQPQRFLEVTLPLVAPLFSRAVQFAVLAIGLAGLYLVSRQWDEFIAEARGLATLGGLAAFGITLFVVKIFHELGHAYAAVRQGCRVPSMGLALMLMVPLLYTDVTDAWRLPSRRTRLAIDAAGVSVEIGLACIATFAWAFLPDGNARHIAFLIATTSWIMSVVVNLNPLMRFDGYYMLSDVIGVPNLQSRAFALGRWRLREILFRPRAPCPEPLPRRLVEGLIVYAWCTWVYRFFLFIGIAALVYHIGFKLLGIALAAFEIAYFIIKPILGEFGQWWTMRKTLVRTRRSLVTVTVIGAAIAAVAIPWSTRVTVPVVLQSATVARVYPPRIARIRDVVVRPGDLVEAGQVIARLDLPDLEFEHRTVTARREAVRLRLERAGVDRDDRDDVLVLERERDTLEARLAGIAIERSELDVTAPQSGRVAEINPGLHPGRWIGLKEPIVVITGQAGAQAIGYVSDDNLWRIEPGNRGVFVPEVPLAASFDVAVLSIAAGSSPTIEHAELTAPHGGTIEVHPDPQQRMTPSRAQYRVVMAVGTDGDPAPQATIRGTVQLDGRAESFLASIWRRVLKVLVRESGA